MYFFLQYIDYQIKKYLSPNFAISSSGFRIS